MATQRFPIRPAVPDSLPISEALRRSSPLAFLQSQIQESQARWAAVKPLLPMGMQRAIKPGPLSEGGWTLLTSNAAVAAKLRQFIPLIETRLNDQGWQGTKVMVKLVQ